MATSSTLKMDPYVHSSVREILTPPHMRLIHVRFGKIGNYVHVWCAGAKCTIRQVGFRV